MRSWRNTLVWLDTKLIVFSVIIVCTSTLAGCGVFNRQSAPGPLSATLDTLRPLSDLAVNPRDQSLLTATAKGVYRSPDQGQSWQRLPIPPALGQVDFTQVVVTPDHPSVLYVSGWGSGVIRSEDDGQTWQAASEGLPKKDVGVLTLHSTQRDTVFAFVKNEGIYRTEDRGQSWRFMHEGPNIENLSLLVHSPLEGSLVTGWVYAGIPETVYLSMDCF